MKTLKEFYDSIELGKQISFYNNQNELILNKNNVCDCEEIVEMYAKLTTYSYETNGDCIYITLKEIKLMNNAVVMTAIERRIDWLYNNVWLNPVNKGKDLSSTQKEIEDLYNAYFELRGHKGLAVFVHGVDYEVNNVDSIYQLTRN